MTDEKSPHVLVSVFREDAKEQDVTQAANKIATIIDEWNMQGNMIWSGSFDAVSYTHLTLPTKA